MMELRLKHSKKRKNLPTKYNISMFLTISAVTDADNAAPSFVRDGIATRCNCSTLFVQSFSCRCRTSKLAEAELNASVIQPNGFALTSIRKHSKFDK